MRVKHTLGPVYDKDSKILILGSIPSVISREKNFYYMNKQNRFWKVLKHIYQDNFDSEDVNVKKNLLAKYHIALYDVIYECDIEGSKDSSIRNVIPADLKIIMENSKIEKIFINGTKAYKYFTKYFVEYLDICYKLPSTSKANAKATLEYLIKEWDKINAY